MRPCCVFWERLAPGKPCQACAASAAYWAKLKPRKEAPSVPYEAPEWSCSTCGLSDYGYERLVSLGFSPHPCHHCRDRFETRVAA